MNELDRTIYRERYANRLREYGHDPKTLGWAAGKQAERFAVLTSFVPLEQIESILDVGCGFGDLFADLRRRNFRGRYTGIDLVPDLIEVGKAAYPEADLRTADIADFAGAAAYDLVIASGIFNAKLAHEENWPHITATLDKMLAVCRVAVAADFLTSYVDFRRDDLYYTSPEELFSYAKSRTRRVAIRHDYMPFEFAIGIFKDDRVAAGARFYPCAERVEGPAPPANSL